MVVKIIIVVLIIIAIPLIIALFTKKEYTVEKDVEINKPRSLVFNYLRLLKNQDEFSVWARMDPDMNKYYRGTDGTPGFVSGWESKDKKVGKGEQEITGITEGQQIDYRITFIEPFAGIANAHLRLDSLTQDRTRVTWHFDSRMKYPMNFMLLFMNMEKMVGNDLATGLGNLKKQLEK